MLCVRRSITGYFDIIINAISVELDSNKYVKLLDVDGTMILVRLPEKEIHFTPFSLVSARHSLAGSAIGGMRETQQMVYFCSKHNITCDIELTPIQKVNEAYQRVVNGDVRYRFVIDMKSLENKA